MVWTCQAYAFLGGIHIATGLTYRTVMFWPGIMAANDDDHPMLLCVSTRPLPWLAQCSAGHLHWLLTTAMPKVQGPVTPCSHLSVEDVISHPWLVHWTVGGLVDAKLQASSSTYTLW